MNRRPPAEVRPVRGAASRLRYVTRTIMTATAPQTDAQAAGNDRALAAASSSAPPRDGIRDTIESIVVAFILAFVFRAFVVEAFVIPTGSMAPGLYGLHAQHRCEMCKYPFVYGIREALQLPGGYRQDGTLDAPLGFGVRCPNCSWAGAGNNQLNRTPQTRVVPDAGDRILVHKWAYDIGGPLLGPKRWDVVVFKDPQDGDTNYIKRMLGLPGEVLEIINGDLYTAPISKVPKDIIDALSQPPPKGNPSARRLTPAQEKVLTQQLRIQRKTPVAQKSLWMIHYDHDYPPAAKAVPNEPMFDPPMWVPETSGSPGESSTAESGAKKGWDAGTPIVRFVPEGKETKWLRLTGRRIQDHYAYNDVSAGSVPTQHDVGDVKLSFVLWPGPTEGELALSLARGPDEFRAILHTDGTLILDRSDKGPVRIELSRAKIEPLRPGQPVVVEFENLDYRVALRINDREVLATTDQQYAPDLDRLLERPYQDGRYNRAEVRIGARGTPLEIRHLVVHRDVFYRSDFTLDGGGPSRQRNEYAQYPAWGTANNPILLREDPREYFCCGDNSPQSKDSRLWWEVAPFLVERGNYSYGTVPEDQLIGRAFFVYWPGGLRISDGSPPIIPNFGRMRIIR